MTLPSSKMENWVRFVASVGLSSSDKYLQMHKEQEAARRINKAHSKTSKRKHKKKSRRGQPVDNDDDDDIPTQHVVSTTYDAPEVSV